MQKCYLILTIILPARCSFFRKGRHEVFLIVAIIAASLTLAPEMHFDLSLSRKVVNQLPNIAASYLNVEVE